MSPPDDAHSEATDQVEDEVLRYPAWVPVLTQTANPSYGVVALVPGCRLQFRRMTAA